jgi:uncharacterized protein (TIGR03067 family)
MKFRIGLAAGAALGVLLLIATDRAKGDDKETADKLRGTWTTVSLVEDGKEQDEAKGDKVTFEAGTITVNAKNGDEHRVTYKVDPDGKAGTIDITPTEGPHKDQVLKGIYRLKGDELKICLARDPDKERPKEFESKEGSGLILSTLKRAKP